MTRYSDLSTFEQFLRGLSLESSSPFYLIVGKDDYDRERAIRSLLHSFSIKSPRILYGSRLELGELEDELGAFSLFASRSVVILHELDQLSAVQRKRLEGILAYPSPGSIWILTAQALRTDTSVFRQIDSHGVIVQLPEWKPWEAKKKMPLWVQEQLGKLGYSAEPRAIQALVYRLGTDKRLMAQELEKLFCYLGDRKRLEVQDVLKVTVREQLGSIWELRDAIFERRTEEAVGFCHGLLEDGINIYTILSQLRQQFQTDYQLASLLSSGGTKEDVTARFPRLKGWILDKHIQMIQKYGQRALHQGLIAIDDMELFAKNSQVEPQVMVDLLLARLMHQSR